MSDQNRLLIAAALMAVVLFVSWQFMGKATSTSSTPQQTVSIESVQIDSVETSDNSLSTDEAVDSLIESPENDSIQVEHNERIITVIISGKNTDIVSTDITTNGAAFISWNLLQYEDVPGASDGGVVDFSGTRWLDRGIWFQTDSPDTVYVEDTPVTIAFTDQDQGRSVEYTFSPDFYGFRLNTVGFDEVTYIPAGILPVSEQNVNASRYFKAQWNAEKVKDRSPGDIEVPQQVGNVKWIAARSHYFAIILMPSSYERAYGFIYPSEEDESPAIGIQDTNVLVYAGPLDYGILRRLGGDTHRLVDFGWPFIREIGRLLFWFCTTVIAFVGNWGIKIILLAVVLKVVLLPLTTKSFRSMAKLKLVQPKMKLLQEKYKNDPKALQEAMQKLYREEGVNPLGGCLPLLMQMPVFFALYRVLANSVQLRGANFMFWIKDLSLPEILIPFNPPILGLHGLGLLAILMGVAMFMQQKMSMTDQKQKGMLYMMPLIMTFLFMRFPAGLTLYWFSNNLLTIGQQKMINRKLEEES